MAIPLDRFLEGMQLKRKKEIYFYSKKQKCRFMYLSKGITVVDKFVLEVNLPDLRSYLYTYLSL